MEFTKKIGSAEYFLRVGDITTQSTEAIVNAANSSLLGGGGVDGAIHRRGGGQILKECKAIVAKQGKCAAGKAVITSGGMLAAKYVIHTVGPFWNGGTRNEEATLRSCYVESLAVARANEIRSISFPSISTGAYRYPVDLAARTAQLTVIAEISKDDFFTSVGFILFSPDIFDIYRYGFPL